MLSKSFMLKPLAAVALVAAAGAAQAEITVFTTLQSFLAAVSASATDTFADFSVAGSTPSGAVRSAGSYGYTASASGSSLYGAGTASNPAMTVNTAMDTLTFASFTGGVQAIGGNFYGTDVLGAFNPGDIQVTATDSSGAVTRLIVGATTSSFLGFVSTGAMSSLAICGVQPSAGTCTSNLATVGPFVWPTVDNLVLASAVPEPGTYALLFSGLGIVGWVARRRRA